MSSKVADYLREHLTGEVTVDKSTLEYFSTDGSIFKVMPKVAVYPQDLRDLRTVLRFSWRMAEKGTRIPITMRGSGTDQSGGAIGSGIILASPAHLNKILSLDTKIGQVTVQPGVNYRALQSAIQLSGMMLPAYPSSIDFSTIGGAIANNASGVKGVKYGSTVEMVTSLEVVLSNGDTITTKRLTRKELAKKKSLSTFEGEIYRQIDGLLQENLELIQSLPQSTTKNSTAYNIQRVSPDGRSFDLTPLFVGSQGTLGIISSATLQAIPYNTRTSLAALGFTKLSDLVEVSTLLKNLDPSALEVVDKHLLDKVEELHPSHLGDIIDKPYPNFVLLVEFDDSRARDQDSKLKKLKKLIRTYDVELMKSTNLPEEVSKIWKLRDSAAIIMSRSYKGKSALPIIEDGCVPPERLGEFIEGIYRLFEKFDLEVAVWGHAGDANLHIEPLLDLTSTGDRQKIFKLMDAYYSLVLSLGGTTSGEHGDGRLRTPYLKAMYSPEQYAAFAKIKQIFDPHNILNPGVKFGTTKEDLVLSTRREFSQHWKSKVALTSS